MAVWNCFENIAGADDVATIKCLEPVFANVVTFLVYLSGIALFIMLLVGGFSFLFSSGDPKKLEQARNTISYAIIGLVLIVSSYLIISLLSDFTGIKELKEFKINF